MHLREMLKYLVDCGGSDLHVTNDSPPVVRVDGKLQPIAGAAPLTGEETRLLCYSVLTDAQKQRFEEENELDLAFDVRGVARFRGNLFVQRGAVAGAFRVIPHRIPTFEELGLPPVVAEISSRPRGLVLVTGPTGSGKSTTLASMIDRINAQRHEHIITVEDPIEYLHPHRLCLVNQREVGADSKSFRAALKYVPRQDPDIIQIGEMRDTETIEAALTLAETGHLCLATLHTNSSVQSINRIIDVFPPHQQPQIRTLLSFVLEGVLSQNLVPRIGGGRVLALEIMVPNSAIRNLIRDDKIHQIYSQMQVGQLKFGMQTMNQSLCSLAARRLITEDDAMGRSPEPDELRQMLAGGGASQALRRQPAGLR